MEAGRMISEREAVLRERKAAARMRCAVQHEMDLYDFGDGPCGKCEHRAKELYPLPKISVPRVVLIDDLEYRIVDGVVQYRAKAGEWSSDPDFQPDVIRAFSGLLANPTELIDDDGSANPIVEVSRG